MKLQLDQLIQNFEQVTQQLKVLEAVFALVPGRPHSQSIESWISYADEAAASFDWSTSRSIQVQEDGEE